MVKDINDKEFNHIKMIMYSLAGVNLKPTKKPMIMTRLRKRLEQLGCKDFSEYISLLRDKRKNEIDFLVNALTTNETYFFRHTKQFNFLYENILPKLYIKKVNDPSREVRIWSAASSTGEEAYSIAITCKEFFKFHSNWKVSIFASDINTDVLEDARKGVYCERSVKEIPKPLFEKYFSLKERNERLQKSYFQLKEDVVKSVVFSQHNLTKSFSEKNLDIIFLRNAMIYFDNESKAFVVDNLKKVLAPDGYLFVSLSENFIDVKSKFKTIFPGVYQQE